MKSLLLVTELFHPSVGGQEIRYFELGVQFVKNGWHVEVVTIATDAKSPEVEQINGIVVRRLVRDLNYQRPNSRVRRNPTTILNFSWKVRQFLDNRQFDAIIFNMFPILPQILSHVPDGTIAMMDWCEHRSNGPWPLLNRLLARSTKKHIAISDGVRDLLAKRYGITDLISVPGGIHIQMYDATQAKAGALLFGRLSEHKHPEEAIQAVIIARENGFKEHLTIAGGGPLLDELKHEYGHLDFIRILGRVSDELKIKLFAEHRLYLLPSEREGFPRTVAEAMASGTPTITTNHLDNGTVDIVRQYACGEVVEPGAQSISEAIVRFTSDTQYWEQFSQNCLQRSAELDWQFVYQKLTTHIGNKAS